jgi:predicted MFS family arabinose efflux permease
LSEQAGKPEPRKGAWRTLWVMAGAQFVDMAEGNALGNAFPSIQRTLGLDVGHLGTINAIKHFVGILFGPLWSMAADRYSRKRVLVWGTGVWGMWTILLGFAASYRQLLILSILSGIGLVALGGPRGSLVSDLFPREKRGRAFGILETATFVGLLAAVLIFVPLLDIPDLGWRIIFWVFGGMSVLSGVLIWLFVQEPVRGQSEAALADVIDQVGREAEERYRFELRKLPSLVRIPTVLLMWLTGAPRTSTMVMLGSFVATWLADERGFSPAAATGALLPAVVGYGLGSYLGGVTGDWAHRRDPRRGRILVLQACLVGATLFSFLLFRFPWDHWAVYWLWVFLLGLCHTAIFPAAIKPIRVAVLLPEIRATGVAVEGIVGGLLYSLASYVIGQMGLRMGLTAALLYSGTLAYGVHALLCFAFYYTYDRDADKMQQTLAQRRDELIAGRG